MTNVPVPVEVVPDPKRPYKAIATLVITFLGLLWANLEGKRDTLDNMTKWEWLTVIVPTIIATGAVYGISNPMIIKRQ